ncbi:hypothetical protein BS47DRAFT_1365634 [Hydnum rufescens UP504]|uniref:Uncharacterized protein n=1 Tax=Hydnum rufescens UP504 TaxID=1448309 RepID=A0A9P6DND2_9AGAM|nr:hypothetical protein BS47DRAFT_1365634 [Hydnum rufescens UP504]
MTTPRCKMNMQPQYKQVPHTHFSGFKSRLPKQQPTPTATHNGEVQSHTPSTTHLPKQWPLTTRTFPGSGTTPLDSSRESMTVPLGQSLLLYAFHHDLLSFTTFSPGPGQSQCLALFAAPPPEASAKGGNKEAELLKNLLEVKTPTTFEALATHLRKLYRQTDRRQRYTQEQLADFCQQKRMIINEADLDDYYCEFITQVQCLDEKKVLAEQDRDDLFWQGIPQHLQKIILPLFCYVPGFDDTKPLDCTIAYDTMKTILKEDRYYNFRCLNKERL